MLERKYYPFGERGNVRDYLSALRSNPQKRKAAVKLDVDLQTLETFWPKTLNVTVRKLAGWEPLWELKREFDGIAYRVFFCLKARQFWLLSAYEKGSDKTPRSELERAYRRMREVLEAQA